MRLFPVRNHRQYSAAVAHTSQLVYGRRFRRTNHRLLPPRADAAFENLFGRAATHGADIRDHPLLLSRNVVDRLSAFKNDGFPHAVNLGRRHETAALHAHEAFSERRFKCVKGDSDLEHISGIGMYFGIVSPHQSIVNASDVHRCLHIRA